MTARVERRVEVPAPPERVWEFIVDPQNRARSISVVADYEVANPDSTEATWWIKLPIPLVGGTVRVDTEDVERRPPEFVKFVGDSKVMRVVGKHTVDADGEGTVLTNEFVVDGKLPGVETFFKRNLDEEMDNLETTLRADLGLQA